MILAAPPHRAIHDSLVSDLRDISEEEDHFSLEADSDADSDAQEEEDYAGGEGGEEFNPVKASLVPLLDQVKSLGKLSKAEVTLALTPPALVAVARSRTKLNDALGFYELAARQNLLVSISL